MKMRVKNVQRRIKDRARPHLVSYNSGQGTNPYEFAKSIRVIVDRPVGRICNQIVNQIHDWSVFEMWFMRVSAFILGMARGIIMLWLFWWTIGADAYKILRSM